MVLEMKVPSPGESITEVEVASWLVEDGDYVENEEQYINETESEFVIAATDEWKTTLLDDGNGNLILSASSPQRIVGTISCRS